MEASPKFYAESSASWPILLRQGLDDIVGGLRRRESWSFLAWHEVKRQYQRSVLGPFWLTLNMGVLVGVLAWLYGGIFGQPINEFLPYVTLGFVVFSLISGIVTEGCSHFSGAAASIKQSQMPFSVYLFKSLLKHFIIFLHNLTIYVLVWFIFPFDLGLGVLLAAAGVALILISGFFVGLILAPLAARFRDVPPIVASVMQVFFFITPVFWTLEGQSSRAAFLNWNPFYHFLEVVRRPLLGQAASDLNWTVAVAVTLVLIPLGLAFFSRFRAQIPYWV